MSNIGIRSIALHQKIKGGIVIQNKIAVDTMDDLSPVYSPGVAAPCLEIEKTPHSVHDLTMKSNTVAVISDGSAVLGLGNIGASAAIPVMEGKCMLFKKFANIDAFPICLDTQDTEDISAPRCFEIEERLQDIGIPVFHDDQHGTAIVTLAGLINACKVAGKDLSELTIVINGAGAAGTAIAKILKSINHNPDLCAPVKEIIVCDSKGIISKNRFNLSQVKQELLTFTNRHNLDGTLQNALTDADVFIGVSKGNILSSDDIQLMTTNPIIIALANPTPEIDPALAKKAGAALVATGRSDFPKQVNNVLVFPGIFNVALESVVHKLLPG